MKKFLLLALAVLGGVGSVSAADSDGIDGDIYLVGGFNSWNTSANKFEKLNNFEFIITLTGTDFSSYKANNYFKLYIASWDSKYLGPWNSTSNAISTSVISSKNLSAGDNDNFYIQSIDESAIGIQIYVKWTYHENYSDNKWQFDITAANLDKEYTVAFVNNGEWESVQLYCWQDNHYFLKAWPGESLTGTDGVYTKSFYANSNSKIIFNSKEDGNNGSQTSDLELTNNQVYDKDGVVTEKSVSIGTAGYATFSSDYPLNFGGITTLTAYRAESAADGKVNMVQVTGAVPAKTGLFVAGETTSVPTIAVAPSVGTNILVATDGTSVAADNYVFAKQGNDLGFYRLGAATVVDKGKAYLDGSQVNAARLSITFADEASGISSAVATASAAEGCFDLQGRRVAKPAKGLYIVNGKKQIIK